MVKPASRSVVVDLLVQSHHFARHLLHDINAMLTNSPLWTVELACEGLDPQNGEHNDAHNAHSTVDSQVRCQCLPTDSHCRLSLKLNYKARCWKLCRAGKVLHAAIKLA